jgi:hypothetical protein
MPESRREQVSLLAFVVAALLISVFVSKSLESCRVLEDAPYPHFETRLPGRKSLPKREPSPRPAPADQRPLVSSSLPAGDADHFVVLDSLHSSLPSLTPIIATRRRDRSAR